MSAPAGDLAGRSLLAVFAHPDDESLACGGLLAACADRGASVAVVCATHGENRSGVRDLHLYEERPRELAAAARILGVSEVILYEYADGFLPWLKAEEFQMRLTGDVRRLRPDVIVTFGADGLYWHPDHIAIHQMTTAAVAALGSDAPALYYVTMPPGLMRGVVNEYLDVPPDEGVMTPILGMVNPDGFGASCRPPTLVLDIGPWARRKLAALRCHATQIADGVLARIPDEDASRIFCEEHFHRSAVGSPCPGFIECLNAAPGAVS